jgi:hypothetical protein
LDVVKILIGLLERRLLSWYPELLLLLLLERLLERLLDLREPVELSQAPASQ